MTTPPTPTTDPRFERALAFERAMHAGIGEVADLPFGRAYLHPGIGHSHVANFAWAFGDAAGWDSEQIVRATDAVMAPAGLAHRRIVLEGAVADAHAGWFERAGWSAEHNVFMAHAGGAVAPPGAPVEEAGADDLLDPIDHYLATDPDTPYGRDAAVRRDVVEQHRIYGRAGVAAERCFVVRVQGAIVAWAKLWTAGAVVQVEDVVCLEAHRGNGYGRAVVAAATRAALAQDPELAFIVARHDDWPRHLYAKLGYEPVGHVRAFTKDPG